VALVLEITTTAWVATIGLIVALLAADLALSVRRPRAVSFRAAVVQSLFYIAVAMAFGLVFGTIAGWEYIVVILTITTIASLLKARRDPTARAHAGTLRSTSRDRDRGRR
jgi:uncharacterized membrane protein